MVQGIEVFKTYFSGYEDQYMLIGGMACDLLMSDAGLDFRRTKDIDMVLIVEALTTEFARVFWRFFDEGGYATRQRSTGKPEFYRFVNPASPGYPEMVELFSRPQTGVRLHTEAHLTPIYISDDIASLSAILLDEDYYNFLLGGRSVSGEISVLDAAHIIPFKMKAWLDLREKKANGSTHVNDRDLRKHRQDVFRLFQLVSAESRISVPTAVHKDILAFIQEMRAMDIDLTSIHIRRDKDSILDILESIYIAFI